MDFISLTSIRHAIITWADAFATCIIFQTRAPLLPLFHVPTSGPTASAGPSAFSTPPLADEHRHHQQHFINTNALKPFFPLAQLPEDVRLNVLSFLPGIELSRIRGVNSDFLQTTDCHADALWGNLCRHDFPSVLSLLAEGANQLCPHQQYVINVMHRANDEVRKLRADYCLRESLDAFDRSTNHHAVTTHGGSINTGSKISSKFKVALRRVVPIGTPSGTLCSNGGIVGLVSDLITVPDPLIARALSCKRRAALSTVVVENDNVLFELRRRDFIRGPVNFLPLSTLHLEHTSLLPRVLSSAIPPAAAAARGQGTAGERGIRGGGGGGGHEEGGNEAKVDLLPVAPETPAPTGFLGYAVRLLELRPEHESLRWTVLFTLFKDLVVFETTEQAEAVRARVPDRRLFYCALDYHGAQDRPDRPGVRAMPQISHWGFQRALGSGGGGGGRDTVGEALARQHRAFYAARMSIAFLSVRSTNKSSHENSVTGAGRQEYGRCCSVYV